METKYEEYLTIVNQAKDYNKRLFEERKSRLPFIDAQTGIAQHNCSLWRHKSTRKASTSFDSTKEPILYQYPAVRWHKKRRVYLLTNASVQNQHHEHLMSIKSAKTIQTSETNSASRQQEFSCNSTTASQSQSHTESITTAADSDSRDISLRSFNHSQGSPNSLEGELTTNNQVDKNNAHFAKLNQFNNNTTPNCNEQNQRSVPVNNKTQAKNRTPAQEGIKTNIDAGIEDSIESQTKAAIRMHRKQTKMRNVGQSLMKDSILVKKVRSRKVENSSFDGIANQNGSDCTASKSIQVRTHDGEKRYYCTICDSSYKTRPGLTYHLVHSHQYKTQPRKNKNKMTAANDSLNDSGANTSKISNKTEVPQAPNDSKNVKNSDSDATVEDLIIDCNQSIDKLEGKNDDSRENASGDDGLSLSDDDADFDRDLIQNFKAEVEQSVPILKGLDQKDKKDGKAVTFNTFCDFCLGTATKNRRTKLPEDLVSCTSCGSSGHPTCLQFTETIKLSIKKYDWQCIECKTCSACSTADNESQLLFCDDCDRSYHTYCLNPKLDALPEGSWSCSACVNEFHSNK